MKKMAIVSVMLSATAGHVLPQTLPQRAPTASVRTMVTSAERAAMLELYEEDEFPVIVDTTGGQRRRIEEHEVKDVIHALANQWATAAATTPVSGIQLDNLGELYVAADRTQDAQQTFAKRLATPDLSVADRAYTLELAVKLFAIAGDSARLQIAQHYMRQLAALPAEAILNQFRGEMSLAHGFFTEGSSEAAAEHAVKAIAMIGRVPYARRRHMLVYDGLDAENALSILGAVWSVDTTRRHQLDTLGQQVMALTKAPPEVLADEVHGKDVAATQGYLLEHVKIVVHRNSMLGQPAPPVVATHWYNASPPSTPWPSLANARQIPQGDGKIHVYEFGGLGCASCLESLPKMQRLKERFGSAVEVWYLSKSLQRWGAKDCTPEESAEHIYNYYVVHHKSKVPMGVWAPPVDDTISERGAVLQRPHPTFQAYQIFAVPVFAVVDGRGMLRRINVGGGSKLERELSGVISFLLAETRRTPIVSLKP